MGKRLLPGKTNKDKGKIMSHRRVEPDRTKFIGTKYEIFTMQSEANKLIKRENIKAKKLRRKIKHG